MRTSKKVTACSFPHTKREKKKHRQLAKRVLFPFFFPSCFFPLYISFTNTHEKLNMAFGFFSAVYDDQGTMDDGKVAQFILINNNKITHA